MKNISFLLKKEFQFIKTKIKFKIQINSHLMKFVSVNFPL